MWESQPSISAMVEYLYFVSNRKGGKGGTGHLALQVKRVFRLGSPMWGAAENLGDSINTSGMKCRHIYMLTGKCFIFRLTIGQGSEEPICSVQVKKITIRYGQSLAIWVNPINTYKDEQGLVVNADGNLAYFSSDRPGSKGMDIYYFKMPKESENPVRCRTLKGKFLIKRPRSFVRSGELVDVDNSKSVIQKGVLLCKKGSS
jgi:hypothetical protein